jgi:UDP-N-acetylglucosamine:LPS N-acetylglucosamine transferase
MNFFKKHGLNIKIGSKTITPEELDEKLKEMAKPYKKTKKPKKRKKLPNSDINTNEET